MNTITLYRKLVLCGIGLVMVMGGYYFATMGAAKRALWWGLLGGCFLFAGLAHGQGLPLTGSQVVYAANEPTPYPGPLTVVPVTWDNESGEVCEVDISDDSGNWVCSVFPPPGVSLPSFIAAPVTDSGYFFASSTNIYHGFGQISGWMSTQSNIMQVVTIFGDGANASSSGTGWTGTGVAGMSIYQYPYYAPGSADQFLWGWFLAGWGLACSAIAFQLIFRQVRNLGADAPTM